MYRTDILILQFRRKVVPLKVENAIRLCSFHVVWIAYQLCSGKVIVQIQNVVSFTYVLHITHGNICTKLMQHKYIWYIERLQEQQFMNFLSTKRPAKIHRSFESGQKKSPTFNRFCYWFSDSFFSTRKCNSIEITVQT